jgi:NAD-dependent SIR2 family protein deacetylase
METNLKDLIELAAMTIKEADTILISAGAGIGIDSGLPDFRGNDGFWKAYPRLKEENISFMDLADPFWFRDDPERAWGFYGHRLELYQSTNPHKGFDILKYWCDGKKYPSFVFTSNVDGHFKKSGFNSKNIYECHGSINHLQCIDNCKNKIWPIKSLELAINEKNLRANGTLPRCPDCGSIARPNILMFHDDDWNFSRSNEQHLKFQNWKDKYSQKKIVIIEIGAGKVIPTVRYESEATSGTLIRINPRDSEGPKNTIPLAISTLDALEKINTLLKKL